MDLILRNGTVVDGTGKPGLRADLGVERGKIARVGDLSEARAGREIAPAEREALALASLFGGLCLANAGLGAVHGFAAPILGLA